MYRKETRKCVMFLKQNSEHFCVAGTLHIEHHQTKEPYWVNSGKSFLSHNRAYRFLLF